MTVNKIIQDYLRKNGYDGLAGDECGCDIDELAPCDGPCLDCVPAFKRKATAEDIEKMDLAGYVDVGDIYYVAAEKEAADD